MPRNRLEELNQYRSDGRLVEIIQPISLEGNQLKEFLRSAERHRIQLREFETKINRVKKLQTDAFSSAMDRDKKFSELHAEMDDANVLMKRIRVNLREMKSHIDIEHRDENQSTSVILRIKLAQFNNIQRSFYELSSQYNTAQVQFRDKNRERITRELTLAEKNITPEEIENYLDSKTAVNIFALNIETDRARMDLNEIEARHQEILKLEETLRELNQLFVEINEMVHAQGEVIDRIDTNVHYAVDYVEEANTNLTKARVYQSSARRKKIIIVAIILVVLIVIIGIIVGTTVKK